MVRLPLAADRPEARLTLALWKPKDEGQTSNRRSEFAARRDRMPNDEIRMTKEIRMTNARMSKARMPAFGHLVIWAFVILSTFGFRHPTFVFAQDELVYVKRDTREASRRASLEASGQAVWPGEWHLIGPFENKGIQQSHPPEEEIDLAATYPGKGEDAVWRTFDFPDGRVHSLKKFKRIEQLRLLPVPADRGAQEAEGPREPGKRRQHHALAQRPEAAGEGRGPRGRGRSGARHAGPQGGQERPAAADRQSGGRLGLLLQPDDLRQAADSPGRPARSGLSPRGRGGQLPHPDVIRCRRTSCSKGAGWPFDRTASSTWPRAAATSGWSRTRSPTISIRCATSRMPADCTKCWA